MWKTISPVCRGCTTIARWYSATWRLHTWSTIVTSLSWRRYKRLQATCSLHLTWWMSFPWKTSRSSEAMCYMTTLTPWQFYPTTTWIKPRDSDSCQWSGFQKFSMEVLKSATTPNCATWTLFFGMTSLTQARSLPLCLNLQATCLLVPNAIRTAQKTIAGVLVNKTARN